MFSSKHKTVAIPFVKDNEMIKKFQRVYATELVLIDVTGERFTIYTQDHVKHCKGLRINNPKIGFIIDDIFIAVGELEQMLYGSERFQAAIASRDLKTIAQNMISKYEVIK